MANVLVIGGGLQGICSGYSLSVKNHKVDIIAGGLQIAHCKFFNRVYTSHRRGDYDALILLLKQNKYDVLIPMGDIEVTMLSSHREEIEETFKCKCACPDMSILSIVCDKHRFMEWCNNNGIPHPVTIPIEDNNSIQYEKIVGFPALIKPDFSVGARGITRVDNREEFEMLYPQINKQFGSCTLQELIENEDYYYNVMLYRDKEGMILGSTIIKIVRMYPIHAGSSTCCISVDNNELLNICIKCLDKLNWVGMADFDVLQRKDDKNYKIIEINPRVPASLRGAIISGVNFPDIIVNDCLGGKNEESKYDPGKILRYMGTDILWFLKSPQRFQSKPNWFAFCGKDVFYQDIYRNDISTWWTWLAEGLKKLKKGRKKVQ